MTRQIHLLHVFPSFAVGGSQMRFAQLVRLHAGRYRHTVIALDGDYGMAQRLPPDQVTLTSVSHDKRDLLGSLKCFRANLKTMQPDVLMTYNWGAIEWAMVNRFGRPIRHLHVEDGFHPDEASRQLPRRVWTRRFALSGRHTAVILPSRTLEQIARTVWRLPAARLNYIPNGINYARFAGRPPSTNPAVMIGTVATLRPEKNFARLIQSFGRISAGSKPNQPGLLIVGDGPERPGLEALAERLGLSGQVRFPGASSCPENWLHQMDIFALSSDTEQMPLGVLEAMAAGLPIVSTAVGDVASMVSEANRPFVVKADDYDEALKRLASDPVLRREIGVENAKRASDLFDETVMAARYAELIG